MRTDTISYAVSRGFSDAFLQDCYRILGPHVLEHADFEMDVKHATDVIVRSEAAKTRFMIRVRRHRHFVSYPMDITFRFSGVHSQYVEWQKLQQITADDVPWDQQPPQVMLYVFASECETHLIAHHMVNAVNIVNAWSSGAVHGSVLNNRDGSQFIVFNVDSLIRHDAVCQPWERCVIESSIADMTPNARKRP